MNVGLFETSVPWNDDSTLSFNWRLFKKHFAGRLIRLIQTPEVVWGVIYTK